MPSDDGDTLKHAIIRQRQLCSSIRRYLETPVTSPWDNLSSPSSVPYLNIFYVVHDYV